MTELFTENECGVTTESPDGDSRVKEGQFFEQNRVKYYCTGI